MSNQNFTHCGFSDESSWNVGRYRSIAMVSGTVDDLKAMESELKEVFNESKEIKWKGLKGAEKIQAAMRMVRIAGDYAAAGKCRVDVLIWDAQDTRHNVIGRDDLQNLARMYYHLSHNILRRKWSGNSVWMLLPDEHHEINWGILEQCLDAVSIERTQLSFSATGRLGYRNEFNIAKIKPVESQKYRLTQLADLFAGVSVFSWNNHASFRSWQIEQSAQQPLFEVMPCSASKNSRDRFSVLHEILEVCRQKKFVLSNEAGRLRTPAYGANTPINFWLYQPKAEYDKAPRRDKASAGQ